MISHATSPLAHQPVRDARSLHVVGFEALLRWRHPLMGPIQPDLFKAHCSRKKRLDRAARPLGAGNRLRRRDAMGSSRVAVGQPLPGRCSFASPTWCRNKSPMR